jgi:hypothetical protein
MERARVVTTKPIRLEQLAAELGTDQVFTDEGGVILAEVPQQVLETAIAAHVADEFYGEPEQRDLAALRLKAQAVQAGTDTFTATQIQKVVATLVLKATRRN